MEVRLESSTGPQVVSPSQSIDDFAKQTRLRQSQWAQRLAEHPDAFGEIEQEIDQHYRRGAGYLAAALLGKVTAQPAMAEHTQRIQQRNFVPYAEVARNQLEVWWKPMAQPNRMPVIVPTSPGWDARPWQGQRAFVLTDRTPAAFEEHLRLAKGFIESTGQPKVALIEAWNEWGEGSYCEPHKEFGFGHLDAIRRVFCREKEPHIDFGPADVGLVTHELAGPPQDKTAWEFDWDGDAEGWSPLMSLGDFQVRGGVMSARAIGRDPAFSCGVHLRARQFRAVELRMAIEGIGRDQGQLFWSTSLTSTSEPASVRFELIRDGQMHTYRVDVGANRLWRGLITGLRLDPCSQQGATIRVDWVRVPRAE